MKTELPKSIKNIISKINNTDKIDRKKLIDIISKAKLSEKDFSEYTTFDHPDSESYGRKLIFDNGNFKILLMSWRVGDFTAIHNHGYTEWGCVYFFGEATHRLYKMVDDKLKLVKKDYFLEGQIASVCEDLIHLMGNSSLKYFTTLHVYGSNSLNSNISENAKVYIPEFQKVVTTMGSAYLNMDKNLILGENSFSSLQGSDFIDYLTLIKPFYERNKEHNIVKEMESILDNQ